MFPRLGGYKYLTPEERRRERELFEKLAREGKLSPEEWEELHRYERKLQELIHREGG